MSRDPYRPTWLCRLFGHKTYDLSQNHSDYCLRCFLPVDQKKFEYSGPTDLLSKVDELIGKPPIYTSWKTEETIPKDPPDSKPTVKTAKKSTTTKKALVKKKPTK